VKCDKAHSESRQETSKRDVTLRPMPAAPRKQLPLIANEKDAEIKGEIAGA